MILRQNAVLHALLCFAVDNAGRSRGRLSVVLGVNTFNVAFALLPQVTSSQSSSTVAENAGGLLHKLGYRSGDKSNDQILINAGRG